MTATPVPKGRTAGRGSLVAAAAIGAVGIVFASVQAVQHLTLTSLKAKGHSKCAIGGPFDCDAVYASRYSEIFGVPLASIGAISFAVVVATALFALVAGGEIRRRAAGALFAWSALASVLSVVLLGISIGALGTICPLCTVAHALNFALVAVLWRGRRGLLGGVTLTSAERLALLTHGAFLGAVTLFGVTLTETVYFRMMVPFANVERDLEAFFAVPVHDLDLSTAPSLGRDDAPVTIVEFGDLECPVCRSAFFLYKSVLREYGDRVRLVFRHYPLDKRCNANVGSTPHPSACVAAKASVFAHRNGKFWEYAEALYSRGEGVALKSDFMRSEAVKVGLDGGAWDAFMSDPKTGGDVIMKDIADARKAGVSSTPAFFFNGRRAEGVLVPKMLRAVVDELLAGRK